MLGRLTDRQQDVLNCIHAAIQTTGFPPTRAEIAQSLGFKSANAAEDHLRALERKGVITLTAGSSRGIRIVNQSKAGVFSQMRESALLSMMLPLIGRVAAGSPILASENVEAEYAVADSMFTATPDYLLRVKGLSMKDIGIMDGDLLAVKRASEARDGQIVVARIGEEVTVKRFMRFADHIQLLSENVDFKPIIVRPQFGEFAIEGHAVGLIRATLH